jgi:hypothetical protein
MFKSRGSEQIMGKIFVDISMSLEGFITEPDDTVETPLRCHGEQIHQWIYNLVSWRERHELGGGETNLDADALGESFKKIGAAVMGRRMFDHGENPFGENPPHNPSQIPHHKVM